MALKIKKPPRQLDPELIEEVWPGDPAVDAEQSDLAVWCRDGGNAGLVYKSDEGEPTKIYIRPISVRARYNVDMIGASGSLNFLDEAFRYGFVKADGITPRWDRFGGVRGLHDDTLDAFSEQLFSLPWAHALEAMNAAREGRPYAKENASDEAQSMELTKLIGAHVLALTFRSRRDDA